MDFDDFISFEWLTGLLALVGIGVTFGKINQRVANLEKEQERFEEEGGEMRDDIKKMNETMINVRLDVQKCLTILKDKNPK